MGNSINDICCVSADVNRRIECKYNYYTVALKELDTTI